jgi:hypothetical protein
MARMRQSLRRVFFITAYPELAELADDSSDVFFKPLDCGALAAAIYLACGD